MIPEPPILPPPPHLLINPIAIELQEPLVLSELMRKRWQKAVMRRHKKAWRAHPVMSLQAMAAKAARAANADGNQSEHESDCGDPAYWSSSGLPVDTEDEGMQSEHGGSAARSGSPPVHAENNAEDEADAELARVVPSAAPAVASTCKSWPKPMLKPMLSSRPKPRPSSSLVEKEKKKLK